jgi:hypothetical protein
VLLGCSFSLLAFLSLRRGEGLAGFGGFSTDWACLLVSHLGVIHLAPFWWLFGVIRGVAEGDIHSGWGVFIFLKDLGQKLRESIQGWQ